MSLITWFRSGNFPSFTLHCIMLCSNICEKLHPFEKLNNHSTRTKDMGHVLVWTGCSSAPQGHSVKDRVIFFPPTILCWVLSLIHNNTHSHPGGNSPLPPGTSESNISPDGHPHSMFLTAILETNSQPPIFKIKNPDLQTPQIYTKATLFPTGNHELRDKKKLWAIVMIDPLTISLLTPSCGDIVVLDPQIWIFFHAFYSTRYHIKYMHSGSYMFYGDLTALFQIISLSNPFRFFFF